MSKTYTVGERVLNRMSDTVLTLVERGAMTYDELIGADYDVWKGHELSLFDDLRVLIDLGIVTYTMVKHPDTGHIVRQYVALPSALSLWDKMTKPRDKKGMHLLSSSFAESEPSKTVIPEVTDKDHFNTVRRLFPFLLPDHRLVEDMRTRVLATHRGCYTSKIESLFNILSINTPFTLATVCTKLSKSECSCHKYLRMLIKLGHLNKRGNKYYPVKGSVRAFNQRLVPIPGASSFHILVTYDEAVSLIPADGTIRGAMRTYNFSIDAHTVPTTAKEAPTPTKRLKVVRRKDPEPVLVAKAAKTCACCSPEASLNGDLVIDAIVQEMGLDRQKVRGAVLVKLGKMMVDGDPKVDEYISQLLK